MASTRSTIEIIIEGREHVAAAAARARAAVEEATRAVEKANRDQARATENAERAESSLADARRRSDDATGRVRVAEAALNDLRSRGNASSSQIAAAEERLAAARRNAESASTRIAEAERRVAAAQEELGRAYGRTAEATERHRRALAELEAATRDAERSNGRLGLSFKAVDNAIRNSSGSLGTAISQFAKWGAIMAVVGAAGGLIGQVIAGALPVVAALVLAVGAVALGMDGIKKAAASLGPPFEKLKSQVSAVFEKQLTPVFKQLAGVIPQLSDGFQQVAVAISGVAARMIGFIASSRGVDLLQKALIGTRDLVAGLGAGLTTFLDGFLTAVAAAAPQMTQLGQAIGSVFGAVGDALKRLSSDGTIGQAISGLISTFKGLGDVTGAVVEVLVRMGAALGPQLGSALSTFAKIITDLTPVFTTLAREGGRVIDEFMTQLEPVVRDLAGPLSDLASIIADALVSALQAVGPFLRDVVVPAFRDLVGFLKDNREAVANWAPIILGLWAAFKGYTILSGAALALGRFVTAAGGLKAIGWVALAVGIAAAANAINDLNLKAVGGDPKKLDMMSKTLFDIVGAGKMLLSGDIPGILAQIQGQVEATNQTWANGQAPVQQWIATVQNGLDGLQGKLSGVFAGIFSSILGFVSGLLGAMQGVFAALALIPGPVGQAFGAIADAIGAAKTKVDGFKQSLDTVHDKSINVTANAQGEPAVKGLSQAIISVVGKTVDTKSNVSGTPENNTLRDAIGNVVSKTVATLSHVSGTAENNALRAAIDRVIDKVVKSVSNVFGEGENRSLRAAIDQVISKTVQVVANVFGLGAVQSLISAISSVVSKTVNVVTNFITNGFSPFASGGSVSAGQQVLVGERGPEILTMPRSGMITNAERSRSMLASAAGGGGQPLTVNVMLSQERIAEIARVEIVDANRNVRRTVQAGSGTTF